MQECWADLKNLRKLLYENAKLHWILFCLLTDIMVWNQVRVILWCKVKWTSGVLVPSWNEKKLDLVKHTELAILEELYGITLINECAQSNTPGVLLNMFWQMRLKEWKMECSGIGFFVVCLAFFWDALFTADSLKTHLWLY